MTAYLIRRCGTSIVILLGISIFIYILLHAVFPSPAIVVLGVKASPAAIKAWNAQNGFDEPVIVQYLKYVYALFNGNLGYSYKRLPAHDHAGGTVDPGAAGDIALTIADPRIRLS